MSQAESKPPIKAKRQLSKEEIIEILERNMSMYKEEETFVHYLVELAIHLLEYEYDWAESEDRPDTLKSRPEDLPPTSTVQHRDGKILSSTLKPRAKNAKSKTCRHCGSDIGERVLCPKCHYMNR